jgi:pimeloyl-ACP methyl ester carboxylesterase
MEALKASVAGAGPPLVLLHGFGATRFTWRAVAPDLERSYEVHALDLFGCGASPKPADGDYSPEHQAKLVEAYISGRGLQHVTLMGHSFGGGVALLTALRLRHTSTLVRLVLVDAPLYPQPLPFFIHVLRSPLGALSTRLLPTRYQVTHVLRRTYHDPQAIDAGVVDTYAASLRQPGAKDALVSTARALVPDRVDAIAHEVRTLELPVLVLWGRHDRIVPISTGERLSRELPDATFVIVETSGHAPQEERPAETLEALRAFFARPTSTVS